MDIFKRIRGNNEMIRSRFSVKENVFHAWLALFSDTELVLEEFLGDHWSRLVFDHMVQVLGWCFMYIRMLSHGTPVLCTVSC